MIGGIVAWQDLGLDTMTTILSEVVTYDVATGTASRLTDDALVDLLPSIAPSGTVIAWNTTRTLGTNIIGGLYLAAITGQIISVLIRSM